MNEAQTNALVILNQMFGDDPGYQEAVAEERYNALIARQIYQLRKESGLTQQELANKIGTTQSVISRLEDADYDGHSLGMLERIATALKHRLRVEFVPLEEPNPQAEELAAT